MSMTSPKPCATLGPDPTAAAALGLYLRPGGTFAAVAADDALVVLPPPFNSRILDASVVKGKMYGSDATRHQDDDNEFPSPSLCSSGRGPLGNENEAIATPPPNNTNTHG